MLEYHEVFGHELPPLPRKPVLSDYHTPGNKQHGRALVFIALSMIGIGGVPCGTWKAGLYYIQNLVVPALKKLAKPEDSILIKKK